MFYCDSCAARREWPETAFRSRGRCEMCKLDAECNDLPSKYLDAIEVGRKQAEAEVRTQAEIEAAIKSIKDAQTEH